MFIVGAPGELVNNAIVVISSKSGSNLSATGAYISRQRLFADTKYL